MTRQGREPPPTASQSAPGRYLFVEPVSKNRTLHALRSHIRGQRGIHAEHAQGVIASEELAALWCLPLRAAYRLPDENSLGPVSNWDTATDQTTRGLLTSEAQRAHMLTLSLTDHTDRKR